MDTREVEPNMRECTFNVLIPGRQYTITVTTASRNLNTSVSLEGRTGVCVFDSVNPPVRFKHDIAAASFRTFTTFHTLFDCIVVIIFTLLTETSEAEEQFRF